MQIALHRSKGLVGTLIRWQTRSKYSHASVVLSDGSVIESREGRGVQHLPSLECREGETIDLFDFDHTPDQERIIEDFLRAQIGKKYDWKMVLRFISRRGADRAQSGKWFCSEIVFASLKKALIHLLRATESWEVSPGLLGRSPLLRFNRTLVYQP